jgi:hypothetical protein
LLGQLDEAFKDKLSLLAVNVMPSLEFSYLDSSHIGVLRRVLVLVKTILCEFAFAEIDTQLNEEDHHRLEGGDGAVAGALRGDMFVEQLEGGLLLLDSDEFLGAFTLTC